MMAHLPMKKLLLLLSVFFAVAASASAITITLGNGNRTASLGSAEVGATGDGNPQVGDINGNFPGLAPWTHVGATSLDDGLSTGGLTITFTTGTWGAQSVTGTWSIDPSFWSTYGDAVITMHVGAGSVANTPDYFAWLITPGTTSGTFSYERLAGNGGGFSNIHLWGAGAPTTRVPEAGSSLALLGAALTIFGLVRWYRGNA